MSLRAVWIILLKMPTGINYKTITKRPHSAVEYPEVLFSSSAIEALGRFPFDQKFRDFRFEIEWNGKNSGKSFRNLGIRFECTLFVGISGIIENFLFHSQQMSGLVSLPSVGARTIQFSCRSLFATLQMNTSICFSGKIAGRQDKLPVVFRPVCFISCVNN